MGNGYAVEVTTLTVERRVDPVRRAITLRLRGTMHAGLQQCLSTQEVG